MRDGESNLYQRGGVWWLNVRNGQLRVRQSLRTRDRDAAMKARDAAIANMRAERLIGIPTAYALPADARDIWAKVIKCREAALSRDRKRGRVPTLSVDDLRAIFTRSGGRCELTGIPFSLQSIPGKLRRPFGPSLDRLDNAVPYTFANTRLICVAANIALNEWGERIFRRVAVGYLTRGSYDAVATKTVPQEELELSVSA